MALSDYLRIFRRNWVLIVAATLAGLLLGGGFSLLTPPTYTARTQLFVNIQNTGSVQELQQGNAFTQARVQSYLSTIKAPIVLQPVIDRLGLNISVEELAKKVEADSELNTVIINIAIDDSSPVQAAAIAQSVAESLVVAVDALEKPKSGGTSPVSLSIITPAVAPIVPTSPDTRQNLAFGLFIGLLAGFTAAYLRMTFDSVVRGETDLRKATDAPLLGEILFDQKAIGEPLLTHLSPRSTRAESFRMLRTNLQSASHSEQPVSVLVTSSVPGEGKSTTAINLALALAQAGQRVCLVDADLRFPKIDEYLGLHKGDGLSATLAGSAEVDGLLQPWGNENLLVLPAGQVPPNPSELLGSDKMKGLIGCLTQGFHAVIIDAPPLLHVTDAAVLSRYVNGVVLVVGSQKIKQQDLQKSLQSLSMVGATFLGVVMNLLPAKGPDSTRYTRYIGRSKATSLATAPRGDPLPSANLNQRGQ